MVWASTAQAQATPSVPVVATTFLSQPLNTVAWYPSRGGLDFPVLYRVDGKALSSSARSFSVDLKHRQVICDYESNPFIAEFPCYSRDLKVVTGKYLLRVTALYSDGVTVESAWTPNFIKGVW
jgi:hypothetical protein